MNVMKTIETLNKDIYMLKGLYNSQSLFGKIRLYFIIKRVEKVVESYKLMLL